MKPKQIENSNQIMFLRGDANYTILYFENGNSAMEPCTLKRYEEKLKSFKRVSRSHLVNPKFVQKIENDGISYRLQLWNGKQVSVSRRKRNVVDELRPLL